MFGNWRTTTNGVDNLRIVGGDALPSTCTGFLGAFRIPDASTSPQLEFGAIVVGCQKATICPPGSLGLVSSGYYYGRFNVVANVTNSTLSFTHNGESGAPLGLCINPAYFVFTNLQEAYSSAGLTYKETIVVKYVLSNNNNTLTLSNDVGQPVFSYVFTRQ